ncbi:RluA family pseudouridine synthase [Chloroflexota bacterium]
MASNIKVFSLLVDKASIRLDKYVAETCPDLSRSQAQRLISDGYIMVNNRLAKAGLKLNLGDRLTISLPSPIPSPLLPEAIPLNVIYEDNDLLVIDKPPGLTVHPAPGHPSHTLINAILYHFPPLAAIGDSLRPGIVHRLDKDTSGLILIAKHNIAQLNLINQFKSHSVVKVYLALIKGHLSPQDGLIEAAIGRDLHNRKRMAVVADTRGMKARTRYHVIKYINDYSLLEVKPETGRTHQIRVHLSAIGYPVVGDTVYGIKSAHLSRQFLHAIRLGFTLPSTGEYAEFTSELPPDLVQALKHIA